MADIKDKITAATEASNLTSAVLLGVQSDTKKQFPAALFAAASHTHSFASLTSKPTTLSGFGITDALAKSANLSDLADAATARNNLGLAIGADVQAWASILDTLSALTDASGVLTNDGAGNLSWEASAGGGDLEIGVSLITGGTSGRLLTSGSTVGELTLGIGVFDALAVDVGSAGGFVLKSGNLGTPANGVLTNCTGLPIASGVSGLGAGVTTALAVNGGSAGAFVTNGGALGTPSSGTLTSCTGLPIAGLVASTSQALGVGSIELGHASDATLSRVSAGVVAVEGNTLATLSGTNTWSAAQTMTNLNGNYGGLGGLIVNGLSIYGTYIGTGTYNPGVTFGTGGVLGWSGSSPSAAPELQLCRDAAAVLQLGADHVTTATAQTFKAHDVTTGTGASLTLAGGKGSTAGGALILATSATNGTAAARVTVGADGSVIFNTLPSSAPSLGTNGMVTLELTNNTTLTIKARGSDDITRSGTITLA